MILWQWCGLVVFLEPTFEEAIVGGGKGPTRFMVFYVKSKSIDISGELIYRNCLKIENKKNQLLWEALPRKKKKL